MTSRKLKFAHALLPEGWKDNVVLTLSDAGIIENVASENAEIVPNSLRGFAIPAVPNIHSHAHQRLMAGLAEVAGPGADSFWTWREAMYKFALKISPEDLEAVAAQLYVEMLKSGSTIVGEFQYLHHQPDGLPYNDPAEMSLRCIAAAEQAQIAITMLPTLYKYGGFRGRAASDGQRRFLNDADSYLRIFQNLDAVTRNNPLRQLGISPHSLRAVTAELMREVLPNVSGPIHIHIAEQMKEVEDCLGWSGSRPVTYLLDNFDVSDRWCGIHATHMTPEETERMAKSGMIAGLCPTTEANLGDGTFAGTTFKSWRGQIAIGSDSHIDVSPANDLRQFEYSQRLRDLSRNVMASDPGRSTGRSLLEAVLEGGAKAMAQPVGKIAAGLRADITVLDGDHPALIGRKGDAALDSWIFSGGNPCVSDVFVAGKQVVKDRQHLNEAQILKRFHSAVERLMQ